MMSALTGDTKCHHRAKSNYSSNNRTCIHSLLLTWDFSVGLRVEEGGEKSSDVKIELLSTSRVVLAADSRWWNVNFCARENRVKAGLGFFLTPRLVHYSTDQCSVAHVKPMFGAVFQHGHTHTHIHTHTHTHTHRESVTGKEWVEKCILDGWDDAAQRFIGPISRFSPERITVSLQPLRHIRTSFMCCVCIMRVYANT